MSSRMSSFPDGDATRDLNVGGYQNISESVKLPVRVHALQPLATSAEMRAGAVTTKGVSPQVVRYFVDTALVDAARAWNDWTALNVVNGTGTEEGYGTVLVAGLRIGHATAKLSLSSVGAANTGALYADAALVYNNGFATGISQPSVADDTVQLMFLTRRVGGGWNLIVRYRFAGVKAYTASHNTNPTWVEIPADSTSLLHNTRGASGNDGWRLVAAGASDSPTPAAGQSDFNNIIYAVKHVSTTMTALMLGYQDSENRIYRVGTSTREYRGSAVVAGDPQFVVHNTGDLPTSPAADTIIEIGTSFGSYVKGDRYIYSGTQWVRLVRRVLATEVDSGTATAGQLLTADGSGNSSFSNPAEAFPTGGLAGQVVERTFTGNTPGLAWVNHGKTVHEPTQGQEVPDSWAVNDWIYVRSTNDITLTRGSASQILTRSARYRITANAANTFSAVLIREHGSMISGAESIPENLLSSGSATAGQVATADGTGGVDYASVPGLPLFVAASSAALNTATADLPSSQPLVVYATVDFSWSRSGVFSGMKAGRYHHFTHGKGNSSWTNMDQRASDLSGDIPANSIPDNSVGYDQINDISKAANRIIHYNAAGNGITSSPHTDFDIDGTQITSGTIPAARIPNLDASIITTGTISASRLPTDITSGVGVAPDLNTLWHSPGIYRVAPNTPNAPDPGNLGQGMLVANVNDQTFFDDGADAGAIHARRRVVAITGQGTPSTLATESDVTFTRITDMLTNLNSIAPAAGTKAYYYWHATSRSFGSAGRNTAGTDRPVNSPVYGGITGNLSDPNWAARSAFGEFTSKYQIVCTGGSYLFNVSDNAFFYRTRNSADTGWNNTWTQVTYLGNTQTVTNLSALHQFGFNMIRNLNHLPGETATTHDYYWFIPAGVVANHPSGNTSSSSPFLTRYVSVSGSTELRCIYNIGENSGTGTTTHPRAESVPYSETATTWALVNDSISGGSYSSTNGSLTLTQRFGDNVSITGLPYIQVGS